LSSGIFWNIVLQTPTGDLDGGQAVLESNNIVLGKGYDVASDFDGSVGQVYTIFNPGVWTEVVSTPEPSSWLLTIISIACFALAGLLVAREAEGLSYNASPLKDVSAVKLRPPKSRC
jgi:hypothetical protein